MKTLEFKIVTRVNEGYNHQNEKLNGLALISEAWQEIAKKVMSETGLYIPAVANQSKTIYHTDWGCPAGGEDTVTLTGVANPEFVKDLEQWKRVVLVLAKQLKDELKQATLTVEFTEVGDFVYLV